jgi:hypothetical protein
MSSNGLVTRCFPRVLLICLMGGVIGSSVSPAAAQVRAAATSRPVGSIHGVVVVRLRQPGGVGDIAIPDAVVTIAQAAGGSTVLAQTVSRPNGFFALPVQPTGDYRVCAAAPGFGSACAPQIIDAASRVTPPLHLSLVPPEGVLHGTVVLRDGSPAARSAPAWATGGAAKVTLSNAAGRLIAGPVSVNSAGHYVLAPVAAGSDHCPLGRLRGRQGVEEDRAVGGRPRRR